MGPVETPEVQQEQDPLTAYRQQRDTSDPLAAYRRSREIVLPPGQGEPDIAPSPKLKRLRPVVVSKPEELPKPMQAAEPDVTKVGPTPDGLAGQLKMHAPGQSGHFGTDVAESAMEMVTHPVATARALAETPARAGYTLGKYTRGEGSGKDAAVGAAQTAAMLIGGPAEKLAEPVVARLVGEAAAPVVTRTALGAATGAVFTPDRPAIGATLGGAAGAVSSKGVAAANRAERYARFDELAKQHPDWFGESTSAETETRANHLLPNPNAATARVIDQPSTAPAEPDFTVDEPSKVPSPIEAKGVFGGALEQHGKDYADGKIAPPVPAPRFATAADDANLSHVPNGQPGIQIKPVSEDGTHGMVIVSRDPSGVPQGYLTLEDLGDGKYGAHEVYVRTDARRQGLATSLYSAAKEAGAKNIVTGYGGYSTDEGESLGKSLVGKGVVDQMIPRGSSAPFMNEPATEEAKPAKKEGYDYSSTQMNLPKEAALGIKRLADQIPEEDLAENGRETTPHITVKYGLHGKPLDKVRELLKDEGPVTVKLGKTSIFPNGESGDGDVVKVDIDSPQLHRLNKKIADALPHTDTHPEYQPHATIAYVKPGLGKKYEGNDSLSGEEWVLDRLTFSGKDGKTVEIPLRGERKKLGTPAAPKPPVHDEARVASGRLRDNLESVKSDGLIHEMFRLLGAEDQTDQQRAIYRTVDDPNMSRPVTVPTIKGGRNLQAEALHRIELKKGAAARIEKILNARGLDDEAITRRYAELSEIAAERTAELEGMDNEESGDTSFDFGKDEYTSENGEGPDGGEAAVQRADAGAEGAPAGSAADAGPGERERTPPAKGQASDDVARDRATLYHELHNASTPEARAGVMERIKALDETPPVEEPIEEDDPLARLRTGESSVGAQFDKSLFKKLGANLYKGDIPSVIVKEGIQNAFDSIRPLGDKGRIHVEIDPTKRTITISDNGHGMTPEVASNEFMDVGGSSKLEGSSGGFGLAKVGLLASAEHFSLVTVAEVKEKSGLLGREKTRRILTTISGSADDWINGTLKFASEPASDSQGTGTQLAVTIDKSLDPKFYQAEILLQTVMNAHHEAYQLTGTVRQNSYVPGYRERPSTTSAEDKPVTANQRLELNRDAMINESVPGADIEAIPSKEQLVANGPFDLATEVHILNNGLYQFGTFKSLGAGAPKQLLINIKPTVAVDHPDYPFTTSREDVKGNAVNALAKIYKDMAAAASATEIRDLIRALNAGIKIGSRGSTSLFDTTSATPRATLEELAKKPYVSEMADRFGDMMDIVAKAIAARLTFPEFHFGGLSTAHGYLGINISRQIIADKARALNIGYEGNKSNIILLNPWQLFDELSIRAGTPGSPKQLLTDDEFAPALAEQSYGTIVHEIAHQLARGHGEDFAGTQTRFDAVAVRVAHVALDVLEDVWRVALKGGIRDDVNNLRVEAWGRGKPDIFKKFSGHLRAGPPEGNPGGLPVGSDAASAHLRSSEADGDVGEGNAERKRLGARARGPVRGSEAGSEVPRSNSAGAAGAQPRNGRQAEPAVNGRESDPSAVDIDSLKLPEPSGLSQPRSHIRPSETVRALKAFFNPESLGPEARGAAGTIKHRAAEAYRRVAVSTNALKSFQKRIDKLSPKEQVKLWHDAETGQPIGDAELEAGNRLLRQVTEQRTKQLIAIDRLKAEKTIENYVGRFWSQTTAKSGRDFLRAIMGRRPFEGPKSFLKGRDLSWFVDGLKRADLVPATYNYVESQLAKIAEMERVIAADHMLKQEQELGRAKPIMLGQELPFDMHGDPWVKIDRTGEDPAFNIYLPPDVPHWEAVDTLVYGKLRKLIDALNVEHLRSPKIGGTRLGYAQGDKFIATKFGGAEGVVMHELGHILDARYGLGDRIDEAIGKAPRRTAKRGKKIGQQVPDYKSEGKDAAKRRQTLREELRQLANLRRETLEGVPSTKDLHPTDRAYLHSTPEKMANMVEAYVSARDRFRSVAPGIFEIFDKIVGDHPELHTLRDIQPSLSREEHGSSTRVPGIITGGHWYAPRDAAAVWQNHLSKGLAGNAIYDAAIAPVHAGTQMLLGFSGFHGTVIATEGAFSDLALGIDNLVNKGGHALKAPGQVARAAVSPIAGVTFGRKVMQEYRIPGTHPELKTVLDGMIAGGFRGRATSELWSGDRKDRLKRAFRETLHAESKGRQLWGAARLPFNAIWAGVEMASGPLMSKYVPLMKTAATYNAVAQALEKLPPGTSIDDMHRVMGDIVKEMDYRFGQVDYDNHFINRVAKDLAQLVFLAPGWTFGTLALAGRGLSDVAKIPKRAAKLAFGGKRGSEGEEPPPELIGRSAAYWIGAVLGTMLINGTLTYFNTGERPSGRDYWAFRDGTKDEAGNWNRHTVPGYLMHDIYGWAKHPVHTFKNKFAPTLAFFMRLADNKDYFGDMVYDPDATAPTKLKQAGKALMKEHAPLSVQNYLEGKKRGEVGSSEIARNVFGVTPARRELIRTPAQNKMAEYLARHAAATRTPEEAEKAELHRTVTETVLKGELLPESVDKALESGSLRRETLMQWIHDARQPSLVLQFKRLSLKEAKRVYDMADDEEKALWANAYRTKVVNQQR